MTLLVDLFLLRAAPFRHACEARSAPRWVVAFIAMTAVTYGVFVAIFQRSLGIDVHGIPFDQVPMWVLLTGNIASALVIAVVAHAGVTLVVWLMVRAVGRPYPIVMLYRITAYALPLCLPALPRVAFGAATADAQTASVPPALDVLAVFGIALGLAALYQGLRANQEITPLRAAFAVILTAVFTGSILVIA